VDFELTSPPRLPCARPDRIERSGDTLLKNDLSLHDIEKIEADTARKDTVSIVVNIGGIAAYPAIVRDDRSYDSLLDTASHEWVHHYLAFYPLGETWGNGGDSEALNETTANIAGREIANLIRKAHPLQLPPGEDGSAPAGPAPTVDFSAEMRALRQQVDQLLAVGKVDEAEKAMEDKRQYLAQHGINIRKINQAYCLHGTYADTPQSSNHRAQDRARVGADRECGRVPEADAGSRGRPGAGPTAGGAGRVIWLCYRARNDPEVTHWRTTAARAQAARASSIETFSGVDSSSLPADRAAPPERRACRLPRWPIGCPFG
jgi:hypothetical protein